jgi:phage-related protein
MSDNAAYRGPHFIIEFAKLPDGSIPGLEFLKAQETRWQARIMHLFRVLGDTGRISSAEQFKKFQDEFFEFKAFQLRLLCYYTAGRRVVITHGFMKKKDVTPKQELVRAKSIKQQYESIIVSQEKQKR